MIGLKGLTKKYDSVSAVDKLDLYIPRGELFGFLGPNGAGKTTTIKMITGLLKPTSGKATINGFDIEKEPVMAKQKIGYVPDEPFIYDKLSGFEFLEFVADLRQIDKKTKLKNIEKYLELFELKGKRDYFIETYSRGMKKKMALAAALIHEPQILLLDEPTTGLDPKSAKQIKRLLRVFCDNGGTVFFSTHILEIAERLCDRVGIINNGRLVAQGSLEELRNATSQENESLEDVFMELTSAAIHI